MIEGEIVARIQEAFRTGNKTQEELYKGLLGDLSKRKSQGLVDGRKSVRPVNRNNPVLELLNELDALESQLVLELKTGDRENAFMMYRDYCLLQKVSAYLIKTRVSYERFK